jgi:RNA polymerase sigma-70 factor, ECF subfamily
MKANPMPRPPDEDAGQRELSGDGLLRFRAYLLMLARVELNDALQAKLDASDIVQQTLLEAHQSLSHYRGQSDQEMAAWLRQILARNMADELKKFRRQKRNVQLEASLAVALDESSMRLEKWITDSGESPSACAMVNEQLVVLADALMKLPEDQRRAIQMHHLHGDSSAVVAGHMQRTEIAVAGLLRRGLKRLRELMADEVSG